MSCSCSKRKNSLQTNSENKEEKIIEEKIIESPEELTLPFETCIECCKKHLSYALVLESGFESYRTLGQLYLAYKHLEKFYIKEAEMLFEMIKDYFKTFKADIHKINEFISMLNKMEVKKVEDGPCLNLEEKIFSRPQLFILYFISSVELLSYEVAYHEVNKPYAIGLLLRAAEMVVEPKRLKLRIFWKDTEKFNFHELNNFLKEEIETYKKIFIDKNKDI